MTNHAYFNLGGDVNIEIWYTSICTISL
jgi:hypothetical protein